jgi:hypothetical protein
LQKSIQNFVLVFGRKNFLVFLKTPTNFCYLAGFYIEFFYPRDLNKLKTLEQNQAPKNNQTNIIKNLLSQKVFPYLSQKENQPWATFINHLILYRLQKMDIKFFNT